MGAPRPARIGSRCLFWRERLPNLRQDAELARLDDGVAARRGIELGEDLREVMVDGARRARQARRDLRVLAALGDELEHLELARRQARDVLARRRPRPAR